MLECDNGEEVYINWTFRHRLRDGAVELAPTQRRSLKLENRRVLSQNNKPQIGYHHSADW